MLHVEAADQSAVYMVKLLPAALVGFPVRRLLQPLQQARPGPLRTVVGRCHIHGHSKLSRRVGKPRMRTDAYEIRGSTQLLPKDSKPIPGKTFQRKVQKICCKVILRTRFKGI